jgi:hypothetical protein
MDDSLMKDLAENFASMQCEQHLSLESASALSLTELLYCHEAMVECGQPTCLEVSLLKGQCCLLLPEAFLECADHMSQEDWALLCELGLQFAEFDMQQYEVKLRTFHE